MPPPLPNVPMRQVELNCSGMGLYLAFDRVQAATDRVEGHFDEVVGFLSPRRSTSFHESMTRKEGATKSSEDNDAVAELGASNTVQVSSVKSRKFFLRGTRRASQRPPSNDLATSMGNKCTEAEVSSAAKSSGVVRWWVPEG
jgi:hypothetical protein